MTLWTLAETVRDLADTLEKIHGAAHEQLGDELMTIVYTHAGIAIASGFIPIPGADLLAGVANIWTMYARLNSAIGLKFSEHALKTIASGVAANIGAALAVMLIAASLAKMLPGLGSIGGGIVVAGLVAASTMVAAMIYIRAITFLAKKTNGLSFSADDLKAAAKQETPSKADLKTIIKENVPSKEEIEALRRKAKE